MPWPAPLPKPTRETVAINKKILILHAPGTNRDNDLAAAFKMVEGDPEIIPLSVLHKEKIDWQKFDILALPGGFSYGDALGAGRLWALDLQTWFSDQINKFVEQGKPVIGICNGFQALVKSGILPGNEIKATLAHNNNGQFECRWVSLAANPSNHSPWLRNLEGIDCPIAHGEGRFIMAEGQELSKSQIGLTYRSPNGDLANQQFPANPNGSAYDIAGITDLEGNVLGLMPHPENHIYPQQHPLYSRKAQKNLGLALFANGINWAN